METVTIFLIKSSFLFHFYFLSYFSKTNNNDLINLTKIVNEIEEKAKYIMIITQFEYNHEVDNWLKEQIKT